MTRQTAERGRISAISRFFNALPLSLSYAILITTWLGFEFFISIQQVLLRRGETWHFIEQQIAYNSLCFLTLLSLFIASNRHPGSPDPELDPDDRFSQRPWRGTNLHDLETTEDKELDYMDSDNIPLRYLKNSQWVTSRVRKDRPSPLPIVAHIYRPVLPSRDSSPSSNGDQISPFPFAASPFVPTTAEDAGEDVDGSPPASCDLDSVQETSSGSTTLLEEGQGETDKDTLLSRTEPIKRRQRTVMSKPSDGGPRWCQKCSLWKPDRAHHCRFCQRCTLKMDHHCIWVGNCVGYHNYKSFLLFISYGTLLSVYTGIEAAYETILFFQHPETFYPNTPSCATGEACPTSPSPDLDLAPIIFMLLAILGVFFALTVGGLAGYHWWMACNNITTLENMTHSYPSALLLEASGGVSSSRSAANGNGTWKPDHLLTRQERSRLRREARDINVYDLGWRRNLQSVFGRQSMWAWMWPISRTSPSWDREGGHFFEVDEIKLDRLRHLTRELRHGTEGESPSTTSYDPASATSHAWDEARHMTPEETTNRPGYDHIDADESDGDEDAFGERRRVGEAWFEA